MVDMATEATVPLRATSLVRQTAEGTADVHITIRGKAREREAERGQDLVIGLGTDLGKGRETGTAGNRGVKSHETRGVKSHETRGVKRDRLRVE